MVDIAKGQSDQNKRLKSKAGPVLVIAGMLSLQVCTFKTPNYWVEGGKYKWRRGQESPGWATGELGWQCGLRISRQPWREGRPAGPGGGECLGSRSEGSWEGHRSGFPSWEQKWEETGEREVARPPGWQILLLFLHCKLQSLPDLLHGDKLDGTFLHDEFPGGGVDDSRLGKPRAESHMLHPSLLGYLVVTSEMEK